MAELFSVIPDDFLKAIWDPVPIENIIELDSSVCWNDRWSLERGKSPEGLTNRPSFAIIDGNADCCLFVCRSLKIPVFFVGGSAMVVMKCRAGNGFGGRCQAVAAGSSDRCLDHIGSSEPDCPAPNKILFRFDGVSEEALVAAGIAIIERAAAREDEMARVREDTVAMQEEGGLQPQAGLKPKTGVNPFGVPTHGTMFNGVVVAAVAEIIRQGFRIIDAHGLRGEDRRGNPVLTLVVTLAKVGPDRDRAFELLALVAGEAEKTRVFFVCVNPPAQDRVTGQMVATHCVVCRKAQVGAPAKASLRYDGGFWGLEEIQAPVRK